jgi:ABC-type sugar transport system substrate-binding protein
MLRRTALAFVVLAFMLGLSSAAFAQKATVLRVVVVKTDNAGLYVQEIEKGRELMKKLGTHSTTRVWRARFAGADAGTVVVGIEYPDLATFAADVAKLDSSADYQAWLKGLDKIRKVVSDSLYNEL